MTIKRTTIDLRENLKSEFITEKVGVEKARNIYHTKQNVAPVIDHVKKLKDNITTPGKDFRHVAEVPMVIYQKALREGWHNDQKAWKRWLNDSDNKVFRTWEGKYASLCRCWC